MKARLRNCYKSVELINKLNKFRNFFPSLPRAHMLFTLFCRTSAVPLINPCILINQLEIFCPRAMLYKVALEGGSAKQSLRWQAAKSSTAARGKNTSRTARIRPEECAVDVENKQRQALQLAARNYWSIKIKDETPVRSYVPRTIEIRDI